MGKRYEHLRVAKWDGKNWWVVGAGGRMSSGFGELKFAALGVGRRIAAVPDMTPGRGELWVVEIHPDNIKKAGRKRFGCQRVFGLSGWIGSLQSLRGNLPIGDIEMTVFCPVS